MAKIQYDRLNVLTQTMNLFWQSGYHATSMQALFTVTGLKPGSVYLAFGNKESLFKMSVEHYTNNAVAELNRIFSEADSVGEAISLLLTSFVTNINTEDYVGCFLVKSQLELSNDCELKAYVQQQLKRIEQVYEVNLLSLYEEKDAKEKATSIMLHMFGICVYGYHSKNQNILMNTLHASLPWLPWHQE